MGLKVLHLIDSGGLYGAEKMLLTLVNQQISQGLEPTILSVGLPHDEEKALDIEAQSLNFPIVQWPMKAGLNFRDGFLIAKWAESQKFEILHSHGYKFDILLGLMPKICRRLPLVATSHGYTHKTLFSKLGIYSLVDRVSLFFVDSAVTVSPSYSDLKLGPFRLKRVVIENGIETSVEDKDTLRWDSQKPPKTQAERFNICAIGRLSEEKGFDLLISAIAQLRDSGLSIHLFIAGEGPQRQSLENIIQSLNLTNNVTLLGYISNVAELFDQSDLFVISSYSEGLPITLLEAMKYEVPVLATRVGAIPNMLEHEVSGVLVCPGDKNQLISGIEYFLNLSPNATIALTRNANETLKANYSVKAMSEKYLTVYEKLIDNV